MADTLRPE